MMKPKLSRGAAVLASAAALSMMASPAMARPRGWGGGWGGQWGRHHDRVDAGDVLAGILIIGGIAAIASAASNAGKQKVRKPDYRQPEPSWRDDSPAYQDGDQRPLWGAGTGIDQAVNRCVDEVSRGRDAVDTVDSAQREGEVWRVQGRVSSGAVFSCSIDGDGRIRQVSVGGRAI